MLRKRVIDEDVPTNVKRVKEQITEAVEDFMNGIDVLPPAFRNFLKKYKNSRIMSISVERKPIAHVFQNALSVMSKGKLPKDLHKLGYDKLFHLYSIFTMEDGRAYLIDRQERLAIRECPCALDKAAARLPLITTDIPLGAFFNNQKNLLRGWKRIKYYTSQSNNCQHFIGTMLVANDLMTPERKKFIFQPLKELLSEYPLTIKFANYAVAAGLVVEVLLEGFKSKFQSFTGWVSQRAKT